MRSDNEEYNKITIYKWRQKYWFEYNCKFNIYLFKLMFN